MTEKVDVVTESGLEEIKSIKLAEARSLFSSGRRNYLIKNYDVAADELSEACSIFEELNGPLCDELGMPYLLYAKCLILLAVDDTKVLDVPNEEDEDDNDDDDNSEVGEEDDNENEPSVNGKDTVAKNDVEAEETESKNDLKAAEIISKNDVKAADIDSANNVKAAETEEKNEVKNEDAETNSKNGMKDAETEKITKQNGENISKVITNGETSTDTKKTKEIIKGTNNFNSEKDKPSSSSAMDVQPGSSSENTENTVQDEIEENEVANDLQIAWETLELAGKIFSKQGMNGLPNLAEVHTELGNIEFENNIPEKAREDYEKALMIYKELPIKTYRRAMAEVNYKIGLTFIMQESAPDGVDSFKTACDFLNDEINDIQSNEHISQKDKENIKDMEETQQEILDKITEIEETRQQYVDKVRAALDNFITPVQKSPEKSIEDSATSSKAQDISHLIKRKKQADSSSTEEASPAKRPAL